MRRPGGRRSAVIAVAVLATVAYLTVERSDSTGPAAGGDGSVSGPTGREAPLPDETPEGDVGTSPAFTERVVAVGTARLRVQVADTFEERAQGLMHRDSIEPFDGMLFVFDSDAQARFTMSRTPLPLTIGFYDASGARVDAKSMAPCDDVPERCPTYSAGKRYRYALEVPQGALPGGRLDLSPSEPG